MENIGSVSSDYSYLINELTSSTAKEIRISAILQQANAKMAISSMLTDELTMAAFNTGGYEFDNSVPESSTFSLHV